MTEKELYEKALEEGDIEAYNELGNMYFEGDGVEQDYKIAFEYYLKGVQAGNAKCMDNLGMCYFWGYGTQTDIQKSAFYTEKAAKAGVVRAMYDTGLNYERGLGVAQNISKAIDWLEKAADMDYPTALVELGSIYLTGEYVEKNPEKSLAYYKKGVELGDAHAKLGLATFYIEGQVVDKDLENAKVLQQEAYDYYYELAVVEEESDAQLRLGNFYFYGMPLIGIEQDDTQAAQWYLKAAENGLDLAQNDIGNMYAFGLGVPQNYEKAFYWYSKAAERIDLMAMSNIGNFYYLGRGVEQSYEKAAEYHSKAANLGHPNSQEVLGEMYMKGKGVEQNYAKAAYWLTESCKNGERSAYSHLGDCFRKGLGTNKDERKAFEMYQKGTEMGDLRSKVSVAECLIEGWGTAYDNSHAYNILKDVCNDEETYRENLITTTSREDEGGRVYIENPLDEVILPQYAKAYYLLGVLNYTGNGTKKNNGEAIRLLRIANKLGYKNEEAPNETAEKLLNKIKDSAETEEIADTIDCYIEVRESCARGEHYQIVLHHPDGTETISKIKGRNKFLYILALLIAYEGKSVSGLTTTHFSFMREDLIDMAEDVRVNTRNYENWIDEFIYAEKPESESMRRYKEFETEGYCSLSAQRYSNAFSGANRSIKESCISEDEYETFKLRSTGGKNAITTISIDASQIKLPESLEVYLDSLPTQKEIAVHKPKQAIWLPIKE